MSSPRNSNPTNPWRQKHPVPTAASAKINTSHKPLERKHSSGSCCWYFNSSAFVLCAPKANVSQKLFVGTLFGKLMSWKNFGTRINCVTCLLSRAEEISIRACQGKFFKQFKTEHGRLSSCKENLFIN